MTLHGHDIGVCSWSLRPGSTSDLIERVRSLGLERVQLALAPLLELDDASRANDIEQLRASGLVLASGMINFTGEDYSSIAVIRQTGGFVPDASWLERRDRALAGSVVAQALGMTQVSTHIGFIPQSNHEHYKVMVDRVIEVADAFKTRGLDLLMETGQETGNELLQFLNDVGASHDVYVNFDPANMILYGAGDPTETIATLGRHIANVHLKDAKRSDHPGVKWGTEVPFGSGEVSATLLLTALRDVGYTGPLVIEREAGEDRMEDIATAVEVVQAVELPPEKMTDTDSN